MDEAQDTRKFSPQGQFALDTNYYVKQLEDEAAASTKELRMQRAAFAQLQDIHNNRIDELVSIENELEKVRGAIREHETFAVEQQMKIDEYELAAKDMGFENFEAFMAEVKRSLNLPKRTPRRPRVDQPITNEDEPKE